MASIITAGNATNGLEMSSDGTGILEVKTGSGTGTTAMTIDTSQNVGIGTTTPNTKLSIVGTHASGQGILKIQSSTTFASGGLSSIALNDSDGTRKSVIYQDSTGLSFETGGAQPILFGTNGTERMRIDSIGNLLVGTTSSTNAAKVTAVSSSLSASYQMMMNNTDTGTGSQISMDIYRNSTRVGYITTTNTTTSFTSISDYRLKKDVVPMTNALAAVAQLKPCRYKWKVDGSDGQGFIAHELQAVVPDCVFGEKDAVNEDGSIKPQGIDTSFLVATLTAALQELKAELDVCKAEIAALKGV